MTYLHHELTEAVCNAFTSLKDKVSSDILNYELSILYRNKIYDSDAALVQDSISVLAENIDDVLNEYRNNCLQALEKIFEETKWERFELQQQ